MNRISINQIPQPSYPPINFLNDELDYSHFDKTGNHIEQGPGGIQVFSILGRDVKDNMKYQKLIERL